MQPARKLLIIQRSALRPTEVECKEYEYPQRFIPLGDGHVRDIYDCGQYPVSLCHVNNVHENVFSATFEDSETEVLFRIDPLYGVFLSDAKRERGVVLTYQREIEEIEYLTASVLAVQISFDPILYIECVPISAP
jgi:hypothetical protein